MSNTSMATKKDFAHFLTNTQTTISYNELLFTKTFKGDIACIKANDRLVYKVHLTKKLLIVTNALFCTFNRDAYWGIAKLADLEEVLADANTLIRI